MSKVREDVITGLVKNGYFMEEADPLVWRKGDQLVEINSFGGWFIPEGPAGQGWKQLKKVLLPPK